MKKIGIKNIILASFIVILSCFYLKLFNSYNSLSYLIGAISFSIYMGICDRIEKK